MLNLKRVSFLLLASKKQVVEETLSHCSTPFWGKQQWKTKSDVSLVVYGNHFLNSILTDTLNQKSGINRTVQVVMKNGFIHVFSLV